MYYLVLRDWGSYIKMPRSQYSVIDLFSGCGGLSLGLYNSGWSGEFAIEKNSQAFETLRFNLIEKKCHFEWPQWLPLSPHDINDVLDNYSSKLAQLRGKVTLIAGGPPCQGFSMAGKREEKDHRNQLVFAYIRFVEIIRPKVLIFENVRGFTSPFKKGGVPYSKIVIEQLKKIGYKVDFRILDFSEYGIPQKRRRFILVGMLEGDPSLFFEILESERDIFLKEKGLKRSSNAKDALSDLLQSNGMLESPDRKGFFSGCYGKTQSSYQRLMRESTQIKAGLVPDSHSFAKHTPETLNLFKKIILNAPSAVRLGGAEREKWGIKKRGLTLLDPFLPVPTLTSHPDDFVHYSEPRILTVREYARLQSFPDWFQFRGKYTTGGRLRKVEVPRYTQIGNAIPPLFAEIVGRALKKAL